MTRRPILFIQGTDLSETVRELARAVTHEIENVVLPEEGVELHKLPAYEAVIIDATSANPSAIEVIPYVARMGINRAIIIVDELTNAPVSEIAGVDAKKLAQHTISPWLFGDLVIQILGQPKFTTPEQYQRLKSVVESITVNNLDRLHAAIALAKVGETLLLQGFRFEANDAFRQFLSVFTQTPGVTSADKKRAGQACLEIGETIEYEIDVPGIPSKKLASKHYASLRRGLNRLLLETGIAAYTVLIVVREAFSGALEGDRFEAASIYMSIGNLCRRLGRTEKDSAFSNVLKKLDSLNHGNVSRESIASEYARIGGWFVLFDERELAVLSYHKARDLYKALLKDDTSNASVAKRGLASVKQQLKDLAGGRRRYESKSIIAQPRFQRLSLLQSQPRGHLADRKADEANQILKLPKKPPRIWTPSRMGRPSKGVESDSKLISFIRDVYGPYFPKFRDQIRSYIYGHDRALYRKIYRYEAKGKSLPADIQMPSEQTQADFRRIEEAKEAHRRLLEKRTSRAAEPKLPTTRRRAAAGRPRL